MIGQSNLNVLTVHFNSLLMKLGEIPAVKFQYVNVKVSNCEISHINFLINCFKYTVDKCQRYL